MTTLTSGFLIYAATFLTALALTEPEQGLNQCEEDYD